MIKFWIYFWAILTIVLLAFPARFFFVFFYKRISKVSKVVYQKMNEIKTLDKMKNEILQKRIQETSVEDIWSTEPEVTMEETQEGDQPEITLNAEQQENKIEENNQLLLKQKKQLEKIVFEAEELKKDWKLELYEKKLIEWLAIEPENQQLNKFLADLYFTIWNYKKSLSLLRRIIEVEPEDHKSIRQIGEIYLISWDFETSELLVEKAINLYPTNPKYYISMIEILYNTNRKKEAADMMEKIVKLRPTNVNYMMTLADLYQEIWDSDSARKYYFRVLECEPSNEAAKKKLRS